MDRFGAWELESLIAVGGIGEVWRARRGDQVAALKRLHTHLVRNDAARELFAVEQQLGIALARHPHLVHAVDVGHVEGRPYVALELAPGETLRALAPPPSVVLPHARAKTIVRAVCAATSHLHKHGWIHGDINPANIVVDTNDSVMLIDLGVCRKRGEGGPMRGTHAYMAPEQVRGEAWTFATDVFGLGVVLWELLAGARLFHRGPPWLSMAAVVEEPAPPLTNVDPAVAAIVAQALEKDPAQRLATPALLAAQLNG
jgi:serine/threonine protein kinase